jgi:RimJ/RimL family protein N-acetyltransferase
MAAFVDRRGGATEAVAQSMQRAFADNGVDAGMLVLEVDRAGLVVHEGNVASVPA